MADMGEGSENLADWFKGLGSYHEGTYIDGPKVWELYVPQAIELPKDASHRLLGGGEDLVVGDTDDGEP